MSPFAAIPPTDHVVANGLAFAIRDTFPVSPGHTLVVCRRTISNWWEATGDERLSMFDLVDEVKAQLDRTHAPDGYNVGFNAGEVAGQTIDHLHVHVIPRYKGDVADPRGGVRAVVPHLGNYLDGVPLVPQRAVVSASDGRLYLELVRCLINPSLDRIDLLVSFVMRSGIDLLAGRINDALARGAHIRLLTTDYLNVTDVGALGYFLDRVGEHPSGGVLDARVFCDPATSFHPKAYIFSSSSGRPGVAFVGSSNMSASGLRRGVEWNLQSASATELIGEFDVLWADPRSVDLTAEWLESYVERKARSLTAVIAQDEAALVDEEPEAPIAPWSVQRDALAALEATRIEGHRMGLVVMATGLGKTWVAAFDSTRPEFRRVLFVAHRDEILTQARDVYRRIRPASSLTLFTGSERNPSGDVVFASIQSLHRNLDEFAPDAFDYIVVDEFHHAAAPTYKRALNHFRPKFLLGLTATPDRSDAADLLALCGDNLVYDCGLSQGVSRDLLCPFRYRAIRDVADYRDIPWRSGRFDLEMLSDRLETHERAEQVWDEWNELGGAARRTLAFCCTIRHAEFMARFFVERGASAVAVHSGPASASRTESLVRLEAGNLDVIFTVDLFNEGVDVPSVDAVLMLRPTESPIVFFQQLGRGLRRSEGKTHLDVIDLVGNHRSFLMKSRLLAELAGRPHLSDREAIEMLRQPLNDLPQGCSLIVDLDAIDLLTQLVGAPKPLDRLMAAARAWCEDHGDERPRALELSLVTNRAHDMKSSGGWFGFLQQLGMLSADERSVVELAGRFLIDLEHGGYTKSYKLVTLQAILDMGTLRGASRIRDLALSCRWRIMRDPRLSADLSDATSSFTDVANPTEVEWERYWRKNPIAALVGAGSKGTAAWFTTADDSMLLELGVPEALGTTFDAMVEEIVEYRLHRYLMSRAATRVGERRTPVAPDGRAVDAGFIVEAVAAHPTSVLVESSGGAGADGKKRNPDYVECIDLILARLRAQGAQILDAYVDSGRTRELPIPDRRLSLGAQHTFPLDLSSVDDLSGVRRSLLNSMAKIGRDPGAKESGGNSRKAMRLILGGIAPGQTAAQLADGLASGLPPRLPDVLSGAN